MDSNLKFVIPALMGGSRIFDWGGPRIDETRDASQNVAIFVLKSWPIGGGHGPVPPPPGTAHVLRLRALLYLRHISACASIL